MWGKGEMEEGNSRGEGKEGRKREKGKEEMKGRGKGNGESEGRRERKKGNARPRVRPDLRELRHPPCPQIRPPPGSSRASPRPIPALSRHSRALRSDLAPSPARSSRRTGPSASIAAPERGRAAALRRGDGRSARTGRVTAPEVVRGGRLWWGTGHGGGRGGGGAGGGTGGGPWPVSGARNGVTGRSRG